MGRHVKLTEKQEAKLIQLYQAPDFCTPEQLHIRFGISAKQVVRILKDAGVFEKRGVGYYYQEKLRRKE